MKKEKGKKGTEGYIFEEKTIEEMRLEFDKSKMEGKQFVGCIIGLSIIICLTILIYGGRF